MRVQVTISLENSYISNTNELVEYTESRIFKIKNTEYNTIKSIDIFGEDYNIHRFLLDFIHNIRKSTCDPFTKTTGDESAFSYKNLEIITAEIYATILEINDTKVLDKETQYKFYKQIRRNSLVLRIELLEIWSDEEE